MHLRISWLFVVALCLGYFVVLPDEGTAATKKIDPRNLHWDLKASTSVRVSNPQTTPQTDVEDVKNQLAEAFVGGWSNPGAPLPVTSVLGTLGPDSTGRDAAASRDVYLNGGVLPGLSAYHFTLDFTLPDSSTRGQASTLHVSRDPADPTSLDRSLWQADVDIAMPSQPDYKHYFFVEANLDQPGLSLKSVQTAQAPLFSPNASSSFDIFVELQYDSANPIDPAQPLLWLTTTAVPEPGTLAGTIIAAAGLLWRRRK